MSQTCTIIPRIYLPRCQKLVWANLHDCENLFWLVKSFKLKSAIKRNNRVWGCKVVARTWSYFYKFPRIPKDTATYVLKKRPPLFPMGISRPWVPEKVHKIGHFQNFWKILFNAGPSVSSASLWTHFGSSSKKSLVGLYEPHDSECPGILFFVFF